MKLITALVLSLSVSYAGSQCNVQEACPLDGTMSNRVDTEYANLHEIGIFEHTVIGGSPHRFKVVCNK